MARQSRIIAVSLLLVLVSIAPTAVHAEPVRITSGGVHLWWDGTSSMEMSGPGFSMVVLNTLWGGPMLPTMAAGSIADADWVFPDPRGRAMGFATIDGVPIRDESHPLGYITFGGDLQFDATPFLVRDTNPEASFASFATRFDMSGTLLGFGSGAEPLFSIDLRGQGTTGIFTMRRFETDGGVMFSPFMANQSFVFQDGDAPVPEPTSMLLLGSGLVGLALRRKRRSAQHDE